jgi:hypothetical protein
MPPKGTIITIKREMTLSERKMEGRKKYAKYIVQTLCNLSDFKDPKTIYAKNNGSTMAIVVNHLNNTVTLTIKAAPVWAGYQSVSVQTMSIFDKGDGRFSFEALLTQLDPCFGARCVKNLLKQYADQRSHTCQKRKEINTKQLSNFESRTKQLRNLGFVSDAVGYSNDNYALTIKQITESPDAEWNAFINAISIVEKFTK